jgi:hypothetical protein
MEELLRRSDESGSVEVFPVKHLVTYGVTVKPGHPRLREGAKVRMWLPFPQTYRQQTDVRLIRCEPAVGTIAPGSAPQRSI